MEDRLIDRIFTEIDKNTSRIEKISEIVFMQASSIKFISRIVFIIITFLIIWGITAQTDWLKNKQSPKNDISSVEESVGEKRKP